MAIGRVLCVALPFILTALSLILLLAACLGGVANKDLYMFQVETKNLTLSPASIKNIISRDVVQDGKDLFDKAKDHVGNAVDDIDIPDILDEIDDDGDKALETLKNKVGADGINITAADLGLGDYYNVGLWGYCTTNPAGGRECTKPAFNWAHDALNTTFIDRAASATGKQINIPDEIENAIKAFSTVTKWTEVAFIIALVSLGVQLLFGTFTACSRIVSCVTYIVSSISIVAVLAAAGLSTAMSVVVVGAVEGTAKFYGVEGSFNTTFLALVWTSAAFALAAGFFWLFTICCCAPDKRSRRSSKKGTDGEKLLPTSGSGYQPLHDPQMSGTGSGLFSNKSQYGGPRHPEGGRSDMAYEPYSHRG